MPTLESIDAKIVAFVDTGREIHVMATITHTGNCAVTEDSTIGGRPTRAWLSQPRALAEDGQPRYDIFDFVLVAKDDKSAFNRGRFIRSWSISNSPKPNKLAIQAKAQR